MADTIVKFTARGSKSSSNLAISIHAAGCPCAIGNAKTPVWNLVAASIVAAVLEVQESENSEARGIPIKVQPCAQAVAS